MGSPGLKLSLWKKPQLFSGTPCFPFFLAAPKNGPSPQKGPKPLWFSRVTQLSNRCFVAPNESRPPGAVRPRFRPAARGPFGGSGLLGAQQPPPGAGLGSASAAGCAEPWDGDMRGWYCAWRKPASKKAWYWVDSLVNTAYASTRSEFRIEKGGIRGQKQHVPNHVKDMAVRKFVSGALWSKGRLVSQHTAVSKLVS